MSDEKKLVVSGGPLPHDKYFLRLECGHTMIVTEGELPLERMTCMTCQNEESEDE